MLREETKISEEMKKLTDELSILPLRGNVVFPSLIIPLVITDQRYAKLIDDSLMGGKAIGLFAQKNPEMENPGPDDIYRIGTAGTILKMLRFPDGSVRFLVQGLSRVRIKRFLKEDPFPFCQGRAFGRCDGRISGDGGSDAHHLRSSKKGGESWLPIYRMTCRFPL